MLIAGDANAHAWEWDLMSNDDAIGGDIMDFMEENGFVVMNDSLPTYRAYVMESKTTAASTQDCEDSEDFRGRTAPDIMFF